MTTRKPVLSRRGGTQNAASREVELYRASCKLLGGARIVRHRIESRIDIHLALVRGIPFASLLHLLTHLKALAEDDVASAIGISTRTLRRRRETPWRLMPAGLASRAWLLAEALTKAAAILGGRDEAERWLSRPAMGLDGQRPIELFQTVQGAELVSEFLGRLEYGVYT